MATKRMLVDATHPEETRIVVTNGNRLDEFDFESANRRQLRGNIYLAKVTRVEPSLQAAFVDYGGNRHGFLAFSEIHPDYYQIPVADREALLAAQAEEQAESEKAEPKKRSRRGKNASRKSAAETSQNTEEAVADSDEGAQATENVDAALADDTGTSEPVTEVTTDQEQPTDASPTQTVETAEPDSDDANSDSDSSTDENGDKTMLADDGLEEESVEAPAQLEPADATAETKDLPDPSAEPAEQDETAELSALDGAETEKPKSRNSRSRRGRSRKSSKNSETTDTEESNDQASDDVDVIDGDVEDLGGESEDLIDTRRRLSKKYKIQEVIKRRQVMLVQVVKEERGNKGAALTTYLSLAGRYSVLMPNTARGGGISRKITNSSDRKRLKEVAGELDVPKGMGVILRTAGASRTKPEIKRDFEYLSRLWENVRTLTMTSTAPNLVYAEGSLIKRTIRDLYDKDIDEVLVAGDGGFAEARDFMSLIMPTHTKKVRQYKENHQIFSRFNVEQQLDSMFSPQVTLPAGGYIVINPTEALVSIDVNSGRATREHNIEDTALQTNLEAADEVARQLRLRDMAGLVVIDFIDMTERKSIRAVEKRMKDALKNDRARIQVGRISHFGLLEMSRQRMRFGVLESSTHTCPVCQGAGIVRSVESLALMVLRAVEDNLVKRSNENIEVRVAADVALYILNAKRNQLIELENRYGLAITISADAAMIGSAFAIDRTGPSTAKPVMSDAVAMDSGDADVSEALPASSQPEDEDGKGRPKRRRRNRNRKSDDDNSPAAAPATADENTEETVQTGDANSDNAPREDLDEDGQPRKRRRRGRRGGRRNKRPTSDELAANSGQDLASAEQPKLSSEADSNISDVETPASQTEAPKVLAQAEASIASTQEAASVDTEEDAKPKPRKRTRRKKAAEPESSSDTPAETAAAADAPLKAEAEPKPAKAAEQDKPAETTTEEAKPRKELPPEGEIVTSSTTAKDKPKRGGWWSLGRK